MTGNSAYDGGGAYGGTLYRCAISGNSAGGSGGGARSSILYNCLLTGNSAYFSGGGVLYGTLYNCTLTGNSLQSQQYGGGGAYLSTLYNCIVYYNTATNGANYYGSTLNYCCATPYPGGTGNITNEPMFVDRASGNLRLLSSSPCINAGSNAYASGELDLDGNPRIVNYLVDMGCYETPQAYTGPSPIHYVSPTGHNIWPYTNWMDAATIIQNAIETATDGDTVLVTNGVYDTGGRTANGAVTNRVAIDKPLVVRSVNGPGLTVIKGGGTNDPTAIRCAYLGANATMIGFTLTNGHTLVSGDNNGYGGGAFCESSAVLSNCALTGNSAYDGGGAYGGTLYRCAISGNSAGGSGGGARSSILYNCLLTGNGAYFSGGGVLYGTLYNCTLTGNSLQSQQYGGGGAYLSTLYNCIVYYNTATNGANYYGSTLNYCCATPHSGGTGNITNEPMFAYLAGGNLRLLSNSPCVNAGTNQDWMVDAVDLDGRLRIIGGVVDMGAYERGGIIPSDWLEKYGLSADGESDFSDSDKDGMNNWQEWRCNTDPTNEASFLRFTASAPEGTGFVVRWQSAEGVRYQLKRSTNLITDAFGYLVRTNILATPSVNSETDTTAVGSGPWFYRVGAE